MNAVRLTAGIDCFQAMGGLNGGDPDLLDGSLKSGNKSGEPGLKPTLTMVGLMATTAAEQLPQ
jgi:hypothetical protein